MKLLLLVPLIAIIAVNGLSTEKIHNGPQDYNSSDEYPQRKEMNLVDSKEDSTDDLEPLDIPGSEMLIFEDDKGHIEFELQKSIPKFKEAIHNRTVSMGDDTSLTCIVENISGYLVSWVHSNRQMIISIHNQTITHLPQYSVSYDSKDTWTLSITSLGPDEIGDYICQVNTVPFMSQRGTVKMLDQSWCIFVPLERCIKKEVAEKCPLKCQQDINECRSNNGDCEHNCHNSDGSHSCSCREGYSLRSENRTCQDIDECSLKNGGCEHSCHNTDGSHSCSCWDGYDLKNEMFCQDVDECNSNNGDCMHNCRNSEGSHSCSCREGFHLKTDNITCQDVDECSSNTGGCEHNCHNTEGSHSCSCREGFQLKRDMFCHDIDECSSDNGGCEHDCQNIEGSHSCSCQEGYHLKTDNISCQDVNECSSDNGGCEHNCQNIPGFHRCSCRDGYNLNCDKITCQEILIKASKDTPKMNWQDSVNRCRAVGAIPFVPRTPQDFEIIKSLRLELGGQSDGYLWLPASDMAQEGVLRWWNGEDASSTPGIIWGNNGQHLFSNIDSWDCVFYGALSNGVHMYPCDFSNTFPMICQALN